MQITENLAHFIDTYDSAFVVGTYPATDLLYHNKAATHLFGIEGELKLEVFHSIFENKNYGIEEKIKSGVLNRGYLIVDNVITKKTDDEYLLTDVRLGYFDKDKTQIFIEITPKVDTRLESAMLQIKNSTKAAAILTLDEGLLILQSNDLFGKIFGNIVELKDAAFHNDLSNNFSEKAREQIICNILETLNKTTSFSTEIQVINKNGEEHCYLLELEKHSLDSSKKDMIIAYLTNIEKQVKLEEEAKIYYNFFKSVYNLIEGVWYRIDVKTKTLYHMLNLEGLFDNYDSKETKMEDYINFLIKENVVHPDDQEIYRKSAENSLKGIKDERTVRFSFYNYNYQWHKIKEHHIYDKNGEVVQIIGILINVEAEKQIQAECSMQNQYLSVIQETTTDILYRVDVETMTLYHFSTLATAVGLENSIPNYVETFCKKNIIHPDDQELYLYSLKVFEATGITPDTPIRFSIDGCEYRWFKVTGKKIYDCNGNLKEVFGALVDIDNEHKIQEEATTVNNYFEALQKVSKESFYAIDVKTKILTQRGKVAEELNITESLPDFPESIFDTVYPEDLEKFKEFNENSCNGIPSEIEMRLLTKNNEYQWYELSSQIIYDNKGVVAEIVGKINNINDEKIMSNKFTNLNKYFDAMQSFSRDVLFRVDVATTTLYHSVKSNRLGKIGNVIPDYINTVVREELVHPDDAVKYQTKIMEWFEDETVEYEVRFALLSDDYEWYCIKAKKIYDENGNFCEVLGIMVNTQAQHNIHAEYSKLGQYFNAMQDLSEDVIFHIDIKTKTLTHTNKNEDGLDVPESIPNFVDTFIENNYIHPDDAKAYREYTDKLFAGENSEHKVRALVNEFDYNWFNIKCQYLHNPSNEITEIFGKLENIQRQVELEQKTKFDNLTQALSRETFEEKIIEDLNTNKDKSNALIFVDIDNFKFINDNYGHQYGDFVLQQFTKRISNCIKETDLIGRVGGDEFIVYLKDIGNGEIALNRANIMLERMTRPISNGKISHILGMSMGIAISPFDGDNLETLYANADKAVYSSKDRGKNTATLYSNDL